MANNVRNGPVGKWGPYWWTDKGMHVKVIPEESNNGLLVMRSKVAGIAIINALKEDLWYVDWKIIHTLYSDWVSGRITVNTGILKAAFGLTENFAPHIAEELSYRFGCTSSKPGAFVRDMNFVNIPEPNFDTNKGRNISLLLTGEITSAVGALIENENGEVIDNRGFILFDH